uniref:ATP synthase F0 subunit 8 n=1 Tax=Gnathodentex aureolineatus TaxID=490323 RepID=UPI002028797C|nr:ATP synthase F0 subunit 8 [Gnathodentex aureolineatus]UPX00921.1 ATP synthase F0 subunit 8 [Gnathodentex aureolineatus]
MPQLNPSPWFLILVFSWLVFLVILPSKIMAHSFPNAPTLHSTQKPEAESWSWPWR